MIIERRYVVFLDLLGFRELVKKIGQDVRERYRLRRISHDNGPRSFYIIITDLADTGVRNFPRSSRHRRVSTF
jgi:hypothetical protein